MSASTQHIPDTGGEAKSAEDKGKVGDYLANERTYLAWLRTSVSIMSFGIVIAKLPRDFGRATAETARRAISATNVGVAMTAVSILMAVLAVFRYWEISQRLREGTFARADRLVYLTAGAFLLLGGFVLLYLAQNL
jgi:putative membrane protein